MPPSAVTAALRASADGPRSAVCHSSAEWDSMAKPSAPGSGSGRPRSAANAPRPSGGAAAACAVRGVSPSARPWGKAPRAATSSARKRRKEAAETASRSRGGCTPRQRAVEAATAAAAAGDAVPSTPSHNRDRRPADVGDGKVAAQRSPSATADTARAGGTVPGAPSGVSGGVRAHKREILDAAKRAWTELAVAAAKGTALVVGTRAGVADGGEEEAGVTAAAKVSLAAVEAVPRGTASAFKPRGRKGDEAYFGKTLGDGRSRPIDTSTTVGFVKSGAD